MNGEPWTLLIDPPRPGWYNMAVDCALLDLADETRAGFLRLYRWDPFCLSFGRHEFTTGYHRERIRDLGLDCVRRPTGGRAVWHARELTYAVAAPSEVFGGLRAAYYRIHEVLAEAIRGLGADPELAPPPKTPTAMPAAGPCFSSRAGGEVLVAGRKMIGSAQVRQGDAFLQHGSLLLEDDQTLVQELGRSTEPGGDAQLGRVLGRPVSFEEAAHAVVQAARSMTGPALAEGELPMPARESVVRHTRRFRSPDWTWER